MDREARIAWLVDHYRRPLHRGPLPDADARVPGGNPGCGDVITLYLKAALGEDRVAAVRFEGMGCTLSQAAASILAERTNRWKPTFEEVLAFSYENMMDLLGRPPRRSVVNSANRCLTSRSKRQSRRSVGRGHGSLRAVFENRPFGLLTLRNKSPPNSARNGR